jgi:hypothetical protein
MRTLFIGGTGNISTACTRLSLDKNIEVFHLNRGSHPEKAPLGVTTLKADGKNPDEIRRAVKGMQFDCVVQWVGYSPSQIEEDIEIFGGQTGNTYSSAPLRRTSNLYPIQWLQNLQAWEIHSGSTPETK